MTAARSSLASASRSARRRELWSARVSAGARRVRLAPARRTAEKGPTSARSLRKSGETLPQVQNLRDFRRSFGTFTGCDQPEGLLGCGSVTCRPLPVRLSGSSARSRSRSRWWRRQAPLVLIGLIAASLGAVPAVADPGQIESKRAEAQQVLLEIRALDSRLEKSIEAYDAATGRLHEIQGDLRVNRFEFKVARRNLGAAQTQLAERLRAIYVSGQDGDSTLEILLGSRSLDDVVSSLDALDRVSSADATILRQVQQFRRDVKKHRTLLRRANERQKQVVAERASEKADIQAGLAERQQLLSSIQDEIARLQAEEAARQAELKREAEARLLQQQHQQRVSLQNAVVGPAAETPEATVAPPSQYGGVVGVAMQFLGTPYVWGGSSPGGFDCSGLVAYVYGQEGVSLP